MKNKLFDYVEKDNVIYNLSGATKLFAFLFLTFGVMYTYDIRVSLLVMAFSIYALRLAQIRFSQIKMMLAYVVVFLLLNFVLTFLFSPQYAVSLYGTSHELYSFGGRYVVTAEQLLYQCTKTCKYASVIPLGLLFILTTNPSEFASSVNSIGVNYKAAYAVSLTLRYFPDITRDYQDIALAQQSRGLDLSKKEKVTTRMKHIFHICVPLIFTTLSRIDVVTNAMDLRGFGKKKKRTWYAKRKLTKADVVVMVGCMAAFVGILVFSALCNHGRFYNPFV